MIISRLGKLTNKYVLNFRLFVCLYLLIKCKFNALANILNALQYKAILFKFLYFSTEFTYVKTVILLDI